MGMDAWLLAAGD
jgi:hypothetical protein